MTLFRGANNKNLVGEGPDLDNKRPRANSHFVVGL